MDDKIYYSPISGEALEVGSDGLLHSPNNDLSYTINSYGEVIPLKSPYDGSELFLGNDGLFESRHNDVKYMVNDGKITPLLSPIHNGELTRDADGLYSSPYDSTKYMVSDQGAIKPLIDPFSGGNLTQNPDGTYQSQNTGKPFMYDSSKDVLVPLYVPDDTGELAHIEDGMLVSNETGRRFEIDPNGIVLTPEELAFREIKQQETERFNQMEQDGTIEEWHNSVQERIRQSQEKPLSTDDMRQIINNDLPNNVDELRQMRDQVQQVQQATPTLITATQSTMTIQEFLTANNIQNESDFTNYLRGMGMDGRIADRLGMTNGTNFMSMLGQDMNAQISIIERGNGDKALYVPTTQNSQTASTIEISQNGNVRVIDNQHTPAMVDGIRYGNVNIIDMSMGENGNLNMTESHHEVMPSDGLAPVGSKPRFQVTSHQRPMTITPNGEIKQEMGINRQSILDTAQDGVLKPIQDHEYMQEKLQQLRDMGFDERYFTKPNIAGVNYDVNGNETMVTNENLQQIPEIGINENSFQKPIDPYGEYRESMARLFEQERDPNSLLYSQYTVEYGDKPVCHHQLQQISGDERTVLQQQTFDYNDDFRTGMLEPSITDYAQRSPMMSQQVTPNESTPDISSYQTYSENNNALSINNVDTSYANNIATATPQIEPVVFQQQQAMAMQPMGMDMGGAMLTKTMGGMGGFVNALILAMIVGFVSGLGIWIAMLFLK